MNTLSRAAREATQLRRAELSTFAPIQISSQWPLLFEFQNNNYIWWCAHYPSYFECTICRTSRGGITLDVQHIIDDADGPKVRGTSKIDTHFFVAMSVNNGLKRVWGCSAPSMTVVTRFQKNLNFQNQRSLFEAPRRRRVEPQGRSIIIEWVRRARSKCFENLSFHMLVLPLVSGRPFKRMEAICIIGNPLNNPNARAYQDR